jgi:hypothetical protein
MTYCVVPRPLEAQLLETLRDHYAGEPEVTVIVDRRERERRRPSLRDGEREQRVLRDRRRRRISGDVPHLYGEPGTLVAG